MAPHSITMQTGIDAENPSLLVRLEGTGDRSSHDGMGWPVLVEIYEGTPRLIVWADINQEDPTHIIDLSGALDSARRDEEEDD
jgi:hypothetical protein